MIKCGLVSIKDNNLILYPIFLFDIKMNSFLSDHFLQKKVFFYTTNNEKLLLKLLLIKQFNKIIQEIIDQIEPNDEFFLDEMFQKKQIICIMKLIHRGLKNINIALTNICYYGHPELIELLPPNEPVDWNEGLSGACSGGHLNIVYLMIEKGADDWNGGLEDACFGGHMDIINLMISKGANNWNSGLEEACWHGNQTLIRLMIEKGAQFCNLCRKTMKEHLES